MKSSCHPITCALLLPLTLGQFACAPALPEPSLENVGNSELAESRLSLLRRGRTLTLRNCVGCHALRQPSSLPKDAWKATVERMRADHGVRLDEPDARAIVTYLAEMADSRE